jgi:hypothetical protein
MKLSTLAGALSLLAMQRSRRPGARSPPGPRRARPGLPPRGLTRFC